MYGLFSGYFSDYVKAVLAKYKTWQPLYLTSLIGFDGTTASERVTCFTPQVDSDALIFGAHTNFSNSQVNLAHHRHGQRLRLERATGRDGSDNQRNSRSQL
jgi:hypothetical protein